MRATPALEEQLQDDVHVERVGGRMILPPIGDVHVVRLFGSGSESIIPKSFKKLVLRVELIPAKHP